MPEPRFIHLRLHSEYSVTDGTVRLDAGKNHECPPVLRAAADGMPALALTDLANLFGMVKFYTAARSHGVKPILGSDVHLANEADPDRPYRLLLLKEWRAKMLNEQAKLSDNQDPKLLSNDIADKTEVGHDELDPVRRRPQHLDRAVGPGRLGALAVEAGQPVQGEGQPGHVVGVPIGDPAAIAQDDPTAQRGRGGRRGRTASCVAAAASAQCRVDEGVEVVGLPPVVPRTHQPTRPRDGDSGEVRPGQAGEPVAEERLDAAAGDLRPSRLAHATPARSSSVARRTTIRVQAPT